MIQLPSLRALLPAVSMTLLATGCADLPSGPAAAPDEAPTPAANAGAASGNPLEGARLYADPDGNARRTADQWRATRPADARLMEKIASQPRAIWIASWSAARADVVREQVARISADGAVPVFVLYNIPKRDCGLWSSGGAAGADEYRRWVADVVRAIGGQRAVVVLEPDALPGMDCLSASEQETRATLIRDAVRTLKRTGRIAVYLDAGHARWHAPQEIAERLKRAGIAEADGFSLNVSNYMSNEVLVPFGEAVSQRVGGKHFVIDTSRNGRGGTADREWCNAPDQGLGARPTTATGHPLVDAFLWIKTPGESDGKCNGGPAAGEWWPEYALGLARRASW